jgi:dipeptidyl aminopeptidase/acylaminoacyl peptidase
VPIILRPAANPTPAADKELTPSGSQSEYGVHLGGGLRRSGASSDPRLAPDAESVAFVRTVPDGEADSEKTIYLVSTTGGDHERFSRAEGGDSIPRFPSGGVRLAFVSTDADGEDSQLWVTPTHGGEARRVTDVPGTPADPAWSPDGSMLCFTQPVTAEERDDVDADSQFVTGGSFGGYVTAWIVGQTDRFEAAVAQRGVYHLLGLYGTTDEAFKLLEWDFGTVPPDRQDVLWDHSVGEE